MATLPSNRYVNPYFLQPGGANLAIVNTGSRFGYRAWNGFRSAPYLPPYPNTGSTAQGTVASAPADLSTFIINAPDGHAYRFQFVRAGSVATVGIPIAVPAGGGTAAQTNTAIIAALSAGSGVETDTGNRVFLPFTANSGGAAIFNVVYTVSGVSIVMGGTQATITFTYVGENATASLMSPGRFGKCYCFLNSGN